MSNDLEEIPLGEVGPDLGFDETNGIDKSLKGKVVGNEFVYYSFDAFNVESDIDNKLEARKANKSIISNKFAEKVV